MRTLHHHLPAIEGFRILSRRPRLDAANAQQRQERVRREPVLVPLRSKTFHERLDLSLTHGLVQMNEQVRRLRRLPRPVRRSIRERPNGLPRHRIPTTAAGWSRHSRFRYRRCGRRHTELAARDPVVSRSRISTCRYRHSGLAEGLVQREPVALDHPALGTVSSDRSSRAGHPATVVLAGTSRVTTLPAPIRAPSPIVTFARIVAPEPMEAPCLTSVGSTRQSLSVCNPPCGLVARGYESLMNITPWPMNTLSSMVTPSQMNVWLEILQFLPT